MKGPVLRYLLLMLSVAGNAISADPLPSALRIESLGPSRLVFRAADCTITDVQIGAESIYVAFTGRWSSSVGSPDNEKNGFSVSRDKSISQPTWDFLARRFRDRQGKQVTITITANGGCAVRGGILLVRFPTDSFEIL